jgi:hypothetical protein
MVCCLCGFADLSLHGFDNPDQMPTTKSIFPIKCRYQIDHPNQMPNARVQVVYNSRVKAVGSDGVILNVKDKEGPKKLIAGRALELLASLHVNAARGQWF